MKITNLRIRMKEKVLSTSLRPFSSREEKKKNFDSEKDVTWELAKRNEQVRINFSTSGLAVMTSQSTFKHDINVC